MHVEAGDEIPEWVMPSVRPERMRTMAAILRDPNPVHWDASVVAAMGLGERVINQGPLGLGYMVNLLHAWAGPGSQLMDSIAPMGPRSFSGSPPAAGFAPRTGTARSVHRRPARPAADSGI